MVPQGRARRLYTNKDAKPQGFRGKGSSSEDLHCVDGMLEGLGRKAGPFKFLPRPAPCGPTKPMPLMRNLPAPPCGQPPAVLPGRWLVQKVHAPQGRTPPAGLIALPIAPSGPKCVWVSQF